MLPCVKVAHVEGVHMCTVRVLAGPGKEILSEKQGSQLSTLPQSSSSCLQSGCSSQRPV